MSCIRIVFLDHKQPSTFSSSLWLHFALIPNFKSFKKNLLSPVGGAHTYVDVGMFNLPGATLLNKNGFPPSKQLSIAPQLAVGVT